MEQKVNKKVIISAIVIVLIIAGVFIWKKITKTTIVPFGETVVLDSKEEEKARKRWMPSNCFLHEGKLELTIMDSKIYKNPKEAGIEDASLSKSPFDEKNTYFLLVSYKIHNIDAVPSFPQGFHATYLLRLAPYHLVDKSIKMPKNVEQIHPDLAYCSVFEENVKRDSSILQQPKEGQYYHLAKGDTKKMQSGFYVDKDAYEKGQVILTLPTGHEGPVKTALEITGK